MTDEELPSVEPDAPETRPLVVIALGALYLTQAGRYVMQSGVFGGAPEPTGDWFLAVTSGVLMLAPAAPLLIAGIGFLWFRRPFCYYTAMLVALLFLVVAVVGGVADVIEVVEKVVRNSASPRRLVALGDVVFGALGVVIVTVLHVVVLTERRVTNWFR